MRFIGPLSRIIGAATLVGAFAGFALPAVAGADEVALLKSYEGSWRGSAPPWRAERGGGRRTRKPVPADGPSRTGRATRSTIMAAARWPAPTCRSAARWP